MVILLVGKRDPVYGHAAVWRVSFGIARVDGACILPRAPRPPRLGATKLSCKVAHASVVYPGGSIAHISGDKALVLCQHGSPRTPGGGQGALTPGRGGTVPGWWGQHGERWQYHPRDHSPLRHFRSKPGFMTQTDEGA